MRTYLKPAIEMEAFEVEDVITLSVADSTEIENDDLGAAAPIIDAVDFN